MLSFRSLGASFGLRLVYFRFWVWIVPRRRSRLMVGRSRRVPMFSLSLMLTRRLGARILLLAFLPSLLESRRFWCILARRLARVLWTLRLLVFRLRVRPSLVASRRKWARFGSLVRLMTLMGLRTLFVRGSRVPSRSVFIVWTIWRRLLFGRRTRLFGATWRLLVVAPWRGRRTIRL